jgi:hypothetical protein
METDIVQNIIDEAQRVAEKEFDQEFPLVDPSIVDEEYEKRKRSLIVSNSTITLAEYSVNLNEAIIRNMLEMLEDDLYLYLGEEYGSLHEWASSKLGDIEKSARTIQRWVRTAIAIHKTYMEGLVDDAGEAFKDIGVTKAEVLATAHDLLEKGSPELKAALEEIMEAPTTDKAREVLYGKTVEVPRGVLVVVQNPNGSVHVSGDITFDQLVQWQVSLIKHVDFRMAK